MCIVVYCFVFVFLMLFFAWFVFVFKKIIIFICNGQIL